MLSALLQMYNAELNLNIAFSRGDIATEVCELVLFYERD